MSPKIVDKVKRKKEIALATLDIFAEKGFAATSISEIAKAVGIGKGTIYEYFRSKEEIILSAIEAWVESIQSENTDPLNEIDDPVERLRRYVRATMAAFTSDTRVMRLFVAMVEIVLSNDSSNLQIELLNKTVDNTCSVIIDALLDGVSRGIFHPEVEDNAKNIALNLIAYLDGIGMYYYLASDAIDVEKQVDLYLDELLRGLGGGG